MDLVNNLKEVQDVAQREDVMNQLVELVRSDASFCESTYFGEWITSIIVVCLIR